MYNFEYQKPGALADAVKALGADDAKALAGGMTLIPVLKQRLNQPSVVVDLAKLGLSGITVSGDSVTIGAMTRHVDVANSAEVKKAIPALAALALEIGDQQVRNRGTLGGSVANNDPAACWPAGVLAYGATLLTTQREIPVDAFFIDLFTGCFLTRFHSDSSTGSSAQGVMDSVSVLVSESLMVPCLPATE